MTDGRQQLYRLIMSQLRHDGHLSIAQAISEATLTPEDLSIPNGQLEYLVQLALSNTQGHLGGSKSFYDFSLSCHNAKEVKGLDWEVDSKKGHQMVNSRYITAFIATHKHACTCATFSSDGRYAATGSQDTSIKLLQVDKIESHYLHPSSDGTSNVGAVVMTFYGNTQAINEVAIHPSRPMLASACQDCSIRLFEYPKQHPRRVITDNHPVTTIKYHPSGEYILAGTEHPALRLYSISTLQCYVSRDVDIHTKVVNQVAISNDGGMFISCSKDGSIKIWDGRNMSCIKTIDKAHNNCDINSVQFSKNGKYILSGGMDGVARLFDIAMGQQIGIYGKAGAIQFKCPARFSFDESQVIIADPSHKSVDMNKTPGNGLVFDTLTFEEIETLTGHTSPIRGIAASLQDPYVITCSEDTRARFLIDEAVIKGPVAV